MQRKYDTNGRDMLKRLCAGSGLDIGCNKQKVAPNCIGVDSDSAVCPDCVAMMDALPFDDNSQDFVVSSHCLEHAPDVVAVLAEWCRVVRPGGRIGIVVPDGESSYAATLGDASGTHRQLFTPITLSLFLAHAGLCDVKTERYARPYAYNQTPGIFGTGRTP